MLQQLRCVELFVRHRLDDRVWHHPIGLISRSSASVQHDEDPLEKRALRPLLGRERRE